MTYTIKPNPVKVNKNAILTIQIEPGQKAYVLQKDFLDPRISEQDTRLTADDKGEIKIQFKVDKIMNNFFLFQSEGPIEMIPIPTSDKGKTWDRDKDGGHFKNDV